MSQKIDNAGAIKMETLEEALSRIQGMHSLVERMAIEVKAARPLGTLTQQLKRVATPLHGRLQGQFGALADIVSAILLVAGRGGPDAMKVRAFREHVAQLRIQIDLAMAQTRERHAVREEKPDAT
jgi:hypothetical protein